MNNELSRFLKSDLYTEIYDLLEQKLNIEQRDDTFTKIEAEIIDIKLDAYIESLKYIFKTFRVYFSYLSPYEIAIYVDYEQCILVSII